MISFKKYCNPNSEDLNEFLNLDAGIDFISENAAMISDEQKKDFKAFVKPFIIKNRNKNTLRYLGYVTLFAHNNKILLQTFSTPAILFSTKLNTFVFEVEGKRYSFPAEIDQFGFGVKYALLFKDETEMQHFGTLALLKYGAFSHQQNLSINNGKEI